MGRSAVAPSASHQHLRHKVDGPVAETWVATARGRIRSPNDPFTLNESRRKTLRSWGPSKRVRFLHLTVLFAGGQEITLNEKTVNLGLSPSLIVTGCVALDSSFTTHLSSIQCKPGTTSGSGCGTMNKTGCTELVKETNRETTTIQRPNN